jgi:hypothetical protein
MIRQRENNGNNFGSAVFIVLVFLFICVLSVNSKTPEGGGLNSLSLTDFHSRVAAVNDAQQFPSKKTVIPLEEKSPLILFNPVHKIIAEKNSIQHNIHFFREVQLFIKPFLLQRFYCCYHTNDTEDPPVLS